MKHLQRLTTSIIFGVITGGGWAFFEHVLGLGPVAVWYATGVAATVAYWLGQDDC